MPTFFWNCIAKLCWTLLSLRYKIRVKGLEQLDAAQYKQGILFLPNHPAHLDPLFLFLLLWPKYRMRPVVVEYIYRLRLLKPWMKLVRAISIPNFDNSINQLKVKKANDAIQTIAEELKKGGNFLLYPAGRLKNSAREIIGGASGAHALVKECPNACIVLIRTTGLWGSTFSRALIGKSPHLPEVLWKGIATLLKNGIFFTPRRHVDIEIAVGLSDIPRHGSRLEFNRYLENWYNRYSDGHGKIVDSEPLSLISYSRWGRDVPKAFQPKTKKHGQEEIDISDETCSKIYSEIRRIVNNPGIEINPEMDLAADLGLDSLNVAELIVFISKSYDVEEIHPEDIATVQSVLELAEGSRGSEHSREAGTFHWPKEKGRPEPEMPTGKIFPEAFLRACERMKDFAACGDDLIGVLSYKKMKRAALVLSLYFQKLPGPYVAVLLPASIGSYIVILALQFARKIPVMLNWTLGPRYLEEMMQETGAKTVISSWRFLDRLSHVDLGTLIDKLQLLEDIKEEHLSLGTKLRGAFLSMRSVSAILRALHLDQIDENQPSVILYTSGTEAKPKGVPLSHKNILSNQRSAIQCIRVNAKDILYGILPPFHSFGFSVVGLLPLLVGLRVAFYPDPTDGFALAEGIERWNITLFCSPPSFLKGLLNSAKVEQLKTIRWFISGAEKAPPELFERVEKLGIGAVVIEGYGITECSPVLTITRANLPPKGVGQPLPGIEVCTIHLETNERLPSGAEGEICVRGPNVFNGYLGNPRDPFIEIEGNRWYRTGDIGRLDEEGNLIISGRIKRFTKVGGEMISLGAVEEALVKAFIGQGKISADIPSLAVIADEKKEGQPQLILFSTAAISREEANQILQAQGFSRLVKISGVKKIAEIPLMGTGKTDYRSLQSQLNSNNKANGNAA